MVFVHSRKDTGKTGRILAELAGRHGELDLFDTREHEAYSNYANDVRKSRNREVQVRVWVGGGLPFEGSEGSEECMV